MSIARHQAAHYLAAAALLTVATTAAAQQPVPAPKPAAAPKPAPAHNAQAPSAPAAPAVVSTQPSQQRTTATYGDWEVVCEVAAGPPPQKSCYMDQTAQVQGQVISRILIPLAKGEPIKVMVQVPANVSLAAAPRIMTDAKDAKDPGVPVPLRRCVPGGCAADVELKDDQQTRFRAATEAGKLIYKDAADRDVTVPISFKGFAQAYDALLKQ